MMRRIIGFTLVLCMTFCIVVGSAFASGALSSASGSKDVELASTGADYGLAGRIEDGNILHCFDWTLGQIKEELPNIAKAGFTSVQTSPLQWHVDSGAWYWLYQPTAFNIGNELGSYQDLQSLCSEADNYGIKIIVDVVANHLAGWNDGRWNDNIVGELRNSDYFHNQGGCEDWNNRYDVTHKNIGMPDLNSENTDLQNKVADMITSLKNAGVDGVRWDAAKHIGLPSEGCAFWQKMASIGLYNYGEILDNPAGNSGDDYNSSLMKEYANYIGVTDSSFSGHITGKIRDGQTSDWNANWANKGVPASRIVYWGESHDTFCNHGWTNGLSENTIDRAYAILAARADSQALYFSRPYEQDHDNIRAGVKGKTHFTAKEVAAVNHFHNAMVGTKEYFTSGNNCFVVCREGGAVIVAAGGSNFDITVPNGGGIVKTGSYTDEVSGSNWVVSGDSISGHIGDTGIAVIYSASSQPSAAPTVSATPGSTSFRSDSLRVTLHFSAATSATYSVNGGSFESFYDGQTVTIGSDAAYGSSITLTLRATNGERSDEKTYVYNKLEPSSSQMIYFDNSAYNWSEVYCYMYNDSGANADWPGYSMTRGADNIFTYSVPEQFRNARVLFTESSYTNTNRYPYDGEPGMELSGESMIFGADHLWTVYSGSGPVPTQPPYVEPTQPYVEPTQPHVEPTQPVTPDGKILVGDADLDGKVTILDATRIQRSLAGMSALNGDAESSADADRNGGVTIGDATLIQRYLAALYSAGSYVGQYVDKGSAVEPTSPPVTGKSVVLNASATSAEPEAWYAWTWNDDEGRWVKGEGPVNAVVFSDVDSNIIFVRVNPDMDVDWNNGSVWNQTGDLNTQFGRTFVTSGWQAQRMAGDWT